MIIIGEKAQLWISGLSWGYYGEGPSGLHDIMQMIDPSITYDQIANLEWMSDYPIMFENVNGRLILKPFSKVVHSLLCSEENRLPRGIRILY